MLPDKKHCYHVTTFVGAVGATAVALKLYFKKEMFA